MNKLEQIKVGDKFERKGSIYEVASIGEYQHASYIVLYNLDDGSMKTIYFDSDEYDEYTKYDDADRIEKAEDTTGEEPKYIENTEKVKWAMSKMKLSGIIEKLQESLSSYGGQYAEVTGEDADYIIKYFSKPEKFDPIEHFKSGKTMVDSDGVKISFDGEGFKCVGTDGIEHSAPLGFLVAGIFKSLIKGTLTPYVWPERTPQDIIDNARGWMSEDFSKDRHGEENDAFTAVIDAFEKSLEETKVNGGVGDV